MEIKPEVRILGAVDYESAMDLQYREKRRVLDGKSPGAILMLEHDPPVITLGRHGMADNITAPESIIGLSGYRVIRTERGGDVTVHEPGQLVVYYILPVKSKNSSAFVAGIMDPVVDVLNYHLDTDLLYMEKKPACGMKRGNAFPSDST
jgi:lipoate-protein ligase B